MPISVNLYLTLWSIHLSLTFASFTFTFLVWKQLLILNGRLNKLEGRHEYEDRIIRSSHDRSRKS